MTKLINKLTALTAYDYSFAKIFDECGIDIILVGDSLGNVIKGDENTLKVTINEMIYHTKNVAKGVTNALIVADMPYLSYENPDLALTNAKKLLDSGANMIKIEGGVEYKAVFEAFAKNNIRVCGHLGLQPQSVATMGYKVQGQTDGSASEILENAILLEKLGVEILVLECIPSKLADSITNTLKIKTIGIGAGLATNGQILVGYDMLGITSGKIPRFVKNFGKDCSVIQATKNYINEVKKLQFPNSENEYK